VATLPSWPESSVVAQLVAVGERWVLEVERPLVVLLIRSSADSYSPLVSYSVGPVQQSMES